MWTLTLIRFLASGASSGVDRTTTSFLDFSSESKCRAAANALTDTDQVISTHGHYPNYRLQRPIDSKPMLSVESRIKRQAKLSVKAENLRGD
jgi:hypothetical protein